MMDTTLRAAAARYEPFGRMAAGFASGKLLRDPVYRAVVALVPEGAAQVVDVGCGEGYLLALLRHTHPQLRLVGLDHDPRRVELGRKALAGEPHVELQVSDARGAELPAADLITCLDVLHYQPHEQQDQLLRAMAAALRPSGVLVIRDLEPGGGLASWLSTTAERVAMAVGRHQGDGVFQRDPQGTTATLEACGLRVERRPCDEGTPFANTLFVARSAR